MHGRLKVKSTAEQQEAKRKEREKKLKLYNGATSRIFQKKNSNELDEELLHLTGEVLAVNPDFYTLWNFRKETFLHLKTCRTTEVLQKMFEDELGFLETCLKINPKSYGTWHHRCFVLDTTPTPDWPRELELCNQFLKYDERNFHCWDYRRFVVKRSEVKAEAELDFSMTKISNNFSNYSSWHYRSKLLPLIHPDPSQPMGVTEDALLQEYELVQNGIFTDPDDQSNWFYHRWLMGRGEPKQQVNSLHISKPDKRIILSLTKHIQLSPSKCSIKVQLGSNEESDCPNNSREVDGLSWCNHLGNSQSFSTVWVADNVPFPKDDNDSCSTITVSLLQQGEAICSATLHLGDAGSDSKTFQASTNLSSGASRFSQELSAVKTETLEQELDSMNQLIEMETDNKWAALTVILLMKALDPTKYHDAIMKHLTNLEALDFKRKNYYLDLRSKFIVENAIDEMDKRLSLCSKETETETKTDHHTTTTTTSNSSIPPSIPSHSLKLLLQGKGLTTFYHTDLLAFVQSLDLSCNRLSEVKHFGYLQNVRDLCLDNNRISSLDGLGHMTCLECLSLKHNDLSNVHELESLQPCPRLKTLYLEGNPIANDVTSLHGLHEILPHVQIVFTSSTDTDS